jgi:LacI family transcriptional regulator
VRKKQAVTVYDIALAAGVSPATVSRVLRGTSPVAPEKRDAVIAAAEKLRYRPNLMAQDLASGHSQTVGLVIPDTVSSFWGPLVKGVETTLRQNDYNLLIVSAETVKSEPRAVDLLVRHRIDGLVIAGGWGSEDEMLADVGDLPLVALCRAFSRPESRILVRNRDGARRAVEHLLSLGHTQIAHISGPGDAEDAVERSQGYTDALEAAGRAVDPALVAEGDYRMPGGFAAMEKLLASGAAFTAVFVASDQMALGAMFALHSHGVDIPAHVSVVGFDDEVFSAYCWPPLTTMRQPTFEMGQAAAEHILARQRGENPPLPSFDTPLCVRLSTAAPPSGAR